MLDGMRPLTVREEPYERLLARSIVEFLNDKSQRLPLEFY